MISKLQKNITILLSALFGVVLIGGLVMFNWGSYENRLMELRRQVRLEVSEVGLKQIEKTPEVNYMLSHWFDFQKIFTKTIGRRLAVSLDKAVEACGLDFEGQMHDALWDARNTSNLFRSTSDRDSFKKRIPGIKRELDSKEHFTTSLGDLVDMSGFNLPKQ